MKKLRPYRKPFAAFFLILLLTDMLHPVAVYALTGGPSQPEVQSFEGVDTNQMVDPGTGDFVYNIPLLDVGGYPVNISYHSGITMDQEASWVGLGWNINPGVINRNMRGIPDDFKDDQVTKEYNINKNWTAGLDLGAGLKIDGFPLGLNVNMGIYYNNYRGVGFKGGTGFSYSFPGKGAKESKTGGLGGNVGLSVSFDSQNGVGISPNVGLSLESSSADKSNTGTASISMGLSYNSRAGLSALTLSASYSVSHDEGKHNKNNFNKTLAESSSHISFANPAVTPTITFPMRNIAFSAKIQIGGEIPVAGIDISGNLTGDYSEQALLYNNESLGAYGYLYMDQAHQNDRALLDFNREKDQPFRKPKPMMKDEGTPIMAIPTYDYDLFAVSGQGISGQYRLKRSDVGSVYDPHTESTSGSGAISVDVGVGGYCHVAGNVNVNIVQTESGQWRSNNDMFARQQFFSHNNTDYEPAAFINVGEKTIADQDLYDEYGGDQAFRVKIDGTPFVRNATSTIETFKDALYTGQKAIHKFKKEKRDKRNQAISFLTAEEGTMGALDTAILDYPLNKYPIEYCDGISPQIARINRVQHAAGKKHHISEMSAIGTDGKRYVYGIPAYNRKHREATFNIDPLNTPNVCDINTGLANYLALPDHNVNSVNNKIGQDHYFSAENIPDYSHSFLLTGVLSADYVDLTGNGITEDDLGDAARINYTRLYGPNERTSHGQMYNWRVPYGSGIANTVPYKTGMANYQQGLKSYACDDKANYLYGSKEIWMVNSIESKTMVAVFHLSDREDAVGAKDEDGGMGAIPARLKKLDRIDLYSKSDLKKYGTAAIPVKTVHFVYSYNLCHKVDNNTGVHVDADGNLNPTAANDVNANAGKLTLEKIYFTYQNNVQGKLNPYVFHYNPFNPDYHLKHYDRWGGYKSNAEFSATPGGGNHYNILEAEYPYTFQDRGYTDKAVAAWSLQKIDLPTGGSINIDFEADAYSFVQDKKAMNTYRIVGLGKDDQASLSKTNFWETGGNIFDNGNQNNYVFVHVDNPITSTTPTSIQNEIKQKYMDGITNLYYRCAIKMYDSDGPDVAEFVPGYTNIDAYGQYKNDPNTIWIKLHPEPAGKSNIAPFVNPIAKNAWQFLRLNLPSRAYPGGDNLSHCGKGAPSVLDLIKSLIAPLYDIENIFFGFSRGCMLNHRCKDLVLDKSWVRLNCGSPEKLGGGARVKKVTIADSWDKMVVGEIAAQYGQVYDYNMDDGTSSGVAEYEPMTGNDENPFRQPLIYTAKSLMAPNNLLYMEYPLCESYYPSANVVYRQVKTTSFGSSLVSPDKRTGYSLHKFYTAYDFPVISDNTKINGVHDVMPSVLQILSFPGMEYYTGSQGFQIELNDMHGKPKSEAVYDNNGSLISETEYTYRTQNPSAVHKKLNNTVRVMRPDGTINNEVVGRDVDVEMDFRHQNTVSVSVGVMISVDVVMIPCPFPIPVPIPTVFPSLGTEFTQFEAASSMKCIRRYGLLESVTARQYGSAVTTKNLVYDSETGDVILTQTENEFKDPVFSLNYPAHLAYAGMAPASSNIDAEFTDVYINNGKISYPLSINQYFTAGDEVLVRGNHPSGYMEKLWVIDPHTTDPAIASQIVFIKSDGTQYSHFGPLNKVKVIRSGHRNMQSMPIATITSLKDPTLSGSLDPQVANEIINTDVTEYKEKWKVSCDKVPDQDCDHCNIPDCHTMHALLDKIITDNLWMKHTPDNVSLNNCNLDSCFYSNGVSSNDSAGCNNKFNEVFYSHFTGFGGAGYYTASIGRWTLTIDMVNTDPFYYNSPGLDISQLKLLDEDELIIQGDSCMTVCEYYAASGRYYMPSITSGQAVVPFYASLTTVSKCRPICIDLPTDQVINPYRYGLLGNWRPFKKWAYRGFRTPNDLALANAPDIEHKGTYDSYTKFWKYDTTEKKFMPNPALSTSAPTYIDATTITKYNTKGSEIENRDAAGNYSAALYGYLETQATAVAKNARYKDIAVDNFEDYDYTTDCGNPCRRDHFSFRESLPNGAYLPAGYIDTTIAHSGYRSFKITSNGSGTAKVIRDLLEDTENPGLQYDTSQHCYRLKKDGCLPKFSPDTGRYYVSAWVKEPLNCNVQKYVNSNVTVKFAGSPEVYVFTPKGKIIEGWEKIDSVFHVPAGATQIIVEVNALNGTEVNFDDVRIQPFNSSMKAYVYDTRTLRLLAILDENSYTTFFEYDDKGGLIRNKKETEMGIMTLQETRSTLRVK